MLTIEPRMVSIFLSTYFNLYYSKVFFGACS
jgi:hypothetical protein